MSGDVPTLEAEMHEERREDLERDDSWDAASAQRHAPVKGGRAVVSVAFAREDFQRVVAAARKQGTSTSAFIRQAALARANAMHATVTTSGCVVPSIFMPPVNPRD